MFMHRTRSLLLLVLGLAVAPLVGFGSPVSGDDDERDVIVLAKNGQEFRGRILRRRDEDGLVLMQGSRRKVFEHGTYVIQSSVVDNLRTFLKARTEKPSLAEEWQLVARADALGLTRMGDLQAWHVLGLDPRHQGANERLGHTLKKGTWRWKHEKSDKKSYTPEDFEERITEWKTRLFLESENYRIETNTSIQVAVDTLFDLERAYTFWQSQMGAELNLSEVPIDPE